MALCFFSCKHKQTLFEKKSSDQTGISFINHLVETDSINLLTYPYALNGAGVAVGDIDNDGWEDVFFVSNKKGGNKLYLNKKSFQFTDITATAGVQGKSDWSTGVTMVDINADGWLDIYVSTVSVPGQLNSANELYINNKNGTFTEAAASYGLDFKGHTTQAAFFDYDNDGDLDCFLLNHGIHYSDDYRDISSRKTIDPLSGDKLFNNKNGRFEDVTVQAGIFSSSLAYGLGIAVGDINRDGWPDIYASNDFKENDYCYINNGNGTFTEKCNELFGHNSRFSMGNDMADYNNDGWLDIITLDMLSPDEKILKSSVADDDIGVYNYKHNFGFNYQLSRNCLQQNTGGQFFQDVSLQKGFSATDWSWAPLFADFDNDGKKDLYISNGYKYRVQDLDFNAFVQGTIIKNKQQNVSTDKLGLVRRIPSGKVADYLYLQQSDNSFINASIDAGFDQPDLSNGAAYADLDKDGKLDLIVNRLDEPAGIYQNKMPAKNYLDIQLKGNGGNSFGIGATVYIYCKGQVQLYQQYLSRGFMSSCPPVIHAGLGNEKNADSVIVLWPGGKRQTIRNVSSNTSLTVLQKNAVENTGSPNIPSTIDNSWKNVTAASGINFIHREDDFEDLNVQPFLPHSICSQGPKIAVADTNNDGMEDFFVCGAKGQPGQLWVQNNQSTFTIALQNCFTVDSMYEETDALFFDADGDRDMDLYVVSGGNEFFGSNALLKDRLYINNGKGNFTLSNGLPALYENKSCAVACDFDKDGDVDLFIGGRANARMYGYHPASVLLLNDGKGNFSEATEKTAGGVQYVGMVTGACWSDVDQDGWQDLVIAGEWMPICIFKNNKGRLEKLSQPVLEQSSGLWNCIYKADIDGDGDDDFLLGNWGNNSKLTATEKYPLTIFLSDWDKNGDIDPLLCINKNGRYYSFLGKSDLEKRLPYLKKKYLQYTDIAGKSVDELFGKNEIDQSKKMTATTLSSSILWNSNGSFSLQALPDFLQVSPIFSFCRLAGSKEYNEYAAVGNFFDVLPYEGRYDAMRPTMFAVQRDKAVISKGIVNEKGAIRNIQPIKIKEYPALLLAKNNEAMALLIKQ